MTHNLGPTHTGHTAIDPLAWKQVESASVSIDVIWVRHSGGPPFRGITVIITLTLTRTQDLALQQILSSIDLFLFYRTDYTDSNPNPRQNVVVYARMRSAAVVERHTPPRTMLP